MRGIFHLVQMKSSNNPYIILRLIVKIQDVIDECTHILSNSYHRQWDIYNFFFSGLVSTYQHVLMKGRRIIEIL